MLLAIKQVAGNKFDCGPDEPFKTSHLPKLAIFAYRSCIQLNKIAGRSPGVLNGGLFATFGNGTFVKFVDRRTANCGGVKGAP